MHSRSRILTRIVELVVALVVSIPLNVVAQHATSAAAPSSYALIPQPRELAVRDPQSLRHGVVIESANRNDSMAVQTIVAECHTRHIVAGTARRGGALRVQFLRAGTAEGRAALRALGTTFDSAMRDEGYVLSTSPGQVQIIAATDAGIFYGAQTLGQLIDGDGGSARLNGARIRDWPAMRYRGVHDDLSRGPLPTLEFQKAQIRQFAAYKLNVYSPYFEHTLVSRKHPLFAQPGGAMTPDEARALVAYARAYHITVIPEQEAFGHLHQILKYDIYSPLAETPHGDVLAPGQPGALALVTDLVGELNTIFPSPFLHLGADETFELGRGQSLARARTEGVGAIYMDFIAKLDSIVRGTGKRMLFWSDIAEQSPQRIPSLPKDLIPVVWGYQALPSFEKSIKPFRDAGFETWVAPGVANWSRVYPNYARSLVNIQHMIRDGQKLGAVGALNTTWDDDGEALFNQTWQGIVFGAAASWQLGESSIADFQQRYGRTFFGDTTGKIDAAEQHLMAAHAMLTKAGLFDANDELFWIDPWSPKGQQIAVKIRPLINALRVHAESAVVLVRQANATATLRSPDAIAALDLGARRMDLIAMHFQAADELANAYTRAATAPTDSAGLRDGALGDAGGRAGDLREAYALLRDAYEDAWRRENRPYWLHNVLVRYDRAIALWSEREERLNALINYGRTMTPLPAPAALGIPTPAP